MTSDLLEYITNDNSSLFLLSEHAGNSLPENQMKYLGLEKDDWEDHISHDVGVNDCTKELARRVGASYIVSKYSRLWVDLNRKRDDPTVIRQIYDCRVITGNISLSQQEKENRLKNYFDRFHDEVSRLIIKAKQKHPNLVLCTIHSFTACLKRNLKKKTYKRPWEIGVLTTSKNSIGHLFYNELQKQNNMVVALDKPYSGIDEYTHTLFKHGIELKIPNFALEIRNDLLKDKEAVNNFCSRVENVFKTIQK